MLLTTASEKLISRYQDKWIDIGLGTEETDEELVRRLVFRMYKPKIVMLCDSPLACLYSFSQINALKGKCVPEIHQRRHLTHRKVNDKIGKAPTDKFWNKISRPIAIITWRRVAMPIFWRLIEHV